MTKELTKKQNTEAAVFQDSDFADVNPDQNIAKNDIMIPKILIMQGMSPKVLDGEAQFGELRDTLNWEVLAKIKTSNKPAQPLKILPIHWEKYWIIKKQDGDKWRFEAMEKMTPETENLDMYETWEGPDNVLRKRVYLHLFYVLIEDKPIPYTLGFRGSSKKAGDALVTQLYVVNRTLNVKEAWKKSPMGKWITITPTKMTKDDNTFAVLEVTPGEQATFEQACEAMTWFKAIKSGEAKADHSDLETEDIESKDSGEF